jgi:nitroreductase
MRSAKVLSLILAVVIVIMAVDQRAERKMHENDKKELNKKIEEAEKSCESQQTECGDTALQTIFARKSVRKFKPGKIQKIHVDMAVRAAMAAPTARDTRPWEFIVIDDRKILDELSDKLPYAKMGKDAQYGVVVAGDLNRQNGGKDSDYWIMDCSAAIENLLLAVEYFKLGAVWTAVYPNEDRIKPVRDILKLPKHIMPLAFIPIGIPDGSETPKNKYNEEQIHLNKW